MFLKFGCPLLLTRFKIDSPDETYQKVMYFVRGC